MSLRELYRNLSSLTPEQRALFARRLEQEGWGRQAVEIVPRPAGLDRVPVSLMQQRLWLLDQMEPGTAHYNLPLICFDLTGVLRPAAMERAFQEIERRHEGLRTVFDEAEDGSPLQVILPPSPRPTPLIDLTALPEALRQPAAEVLAREESRLLFDLANGPLWRTHTLRLSSEHHWVLITMHHIISDAWSLGVFFRELMELYAAYLHGRPSPLPELPIQYADYALWQRQRLQGALLEEELRFWKDQIAGAPEQIELPLDRPRPNARSYRGRRLTTVPTPELAEAMTAFSRSSGASLYMVMLAAFNAALHRFSGQDDLVLAAPVAGRNNTGTESLIGFFVNTVVFRNDLSGDPTFRELSNRVRNVVLDVFEHQELPFDKLVEAVRPRRDTSYGPIYQAVFSLQNTPTPDLQLEGLEADLTGIDNGTSQTDLILFAGTWEGLIGVIQLEYNTDLFDPTTILRMREGLVSLLEAAMADPDRRLSELPFLGGSQRHQVLREWNDTRHVHPQEADTVHGIMERLAERQPDALAVAGPDGSLTFGQLDDRAGRLARLLRAAGVGPDAPAAVCFERSPEMVLAALAALKAGAAYMPLDSTAPAERIAWMVKDAGAPVVLTRQRWAGIFAETGARVICLEAGAADIPEVPGLAPVSSPAPIAGPADLAYVIYTSGSTGKPKGVEVPHGSLLNLLGWTQRMFDFGPEDRISYGVSPAFDGSVWEMWSCLTAGASLHVIPPEIMPSPGDLVERLAAERITRVHLPTVLADAFLHQEKPPGFVLKTLTIGGDRCPSPPEGLEYEFVDFYGPTENAVVSNAGAVVYPYRPALGPSIDNVDVHLLDRHLNPVVVGGVGEICLSGKSMARGYRRRPELTAEKFVPNPVPNPESPGSGQPGGRLYRTGDLARRRADGRLEFLGRVDSQLKLRGFRIELGEIETTLSRHPGINKCAVALRQVATGETALVAYYAPVSMNGGAPEPRELRAFLQRTLPEYMVPTAYCSMPELPLTPNGKLDRKALPAPEKVDRSDEPYLAPRTPTEETLAELWCELLGVDRAGVDDDFFYLGGHSLLAVRLASRLRDRFQVHLSSQVAFQASTLAAMAEAVDLAVAASAAGESLAAGPSLVALPRPGRRVRKVAP